MNRYTMGEARAFVMDELKEAASMLSGRTLQPYETVDVTLTLSMLYYIFRSNPRFL